MIVCEKVVEQSRMLTPLRPAESAPPDTISISPSSRYSRNVNLTAVCASSFSWDAAQIRCLLFDGIGVRHLGIGALAGSSTGLKWAGNSVFPFDFRSTGPPTTHIPCQGYASAFMSGLIAGTGSAHGTWLQHQTSCRDAASQSHSKTKHQLGPYATGNGLSKRR